MRRLGIPLHVLHERLGARASGGVAPAGNAQYKHHLVPSGLTPFERELFERAPLPEDGWTLQPCPKHRDTFAEYEPEAD